jgi:hypothetical protein
MRFFEVLAHVVGLLVLEQRLSYQALKRLFDLDDADIEALKIEIIEVRQLARDHGGRMLVWAGEGVGTTGLKTLRGSYPEDFSAAS